jgi:hypothetical protein
MQRDVKDDASERSEASRRSGSRQSVCGVRGAKPPVV